MMSKSLVSVMILAGLGLSAAAPASAAMTLGAPMIAADETQAATPAADDVRRFRLHGRSHGQHAPQGFVNRPNYHSPIYNEPQYFNPSEPPMYDGLRQDYPGYGLYR